jgi:hypothetical protein
LPCLAVLVLLGKPAGRYACWRVVWWSWGNALAREPRDGAHRTQKNELKPWLKQCWCIPPEANAAFVWRMEDVLEVYTRPYDPRFPQVCMDESAKHLLRDKQESLSAQPGQPERVDDPFESAGMYKLFLACEPLAGKRFIKVSKHRTSQDWARFIRELVDTHSPKAEKIVLVLDNLNTHTPASLYQTFPPAEARRLLSKLEIHYTPVHGSWLNMAEIELSALARQCLSHRIGTREELEREVLAWQCCRNEASITVNWRFTTADARIKLKRLYPSLEPRKPASKKKTVTNMG